MKMNRIGKKSIVVHCFPSPLCFALKYFTMQSVRVNDFLPKINDLRFPNCIVIELTLPHNICLPAAVPSGMVNQLYCLGMNKFSEMIAV